ncbi:hypothetical protein BBJ28_00016631 [Nothophytophthora sp. Chile5]|nr:hypothetical protein BBJ28_00016631 [Nothophytophthora sp. Chile5]
MKFFFVAAAAAALVSTASAANCATSVLAALLTDQYIDQCASDSGYAFTSGKQPDAEEVAGMCASDACHSLLADVEAMNLTECTIPLGDKILLLADLVYYVSDQCDADTPVPATVTPEPTTATPVPTTATPAPTTAIASCTSAQLKYLLTSTYEAQCATDASYVFTSPYTPTDAQVTAMCASESCVDLFAYVASMVTTDCRIPVGGKILLLAGLVDYVTDQCPVDTPEPTTTTPSPTTESPVAACDTSVVSTLLADPYIDQCSSDSGYVFTSGVQPDAEEIAGLCASEACASLRADAEAMDLSECILPFGDNFYLLRDLLGFVSNQCDAETPEPTTATPEPTTATPAPTTATPVATCATSVIASLLTDAYIDQCSSDSGYSFTSGKQPDAEEVTGMCASEACANLLADVEAMGLSECILPIGDKIYLFRDLVDYVSDQCNALTTTPGTDAPGTDAPGTDAPGTDSPTATPTPSSETPEPATTTATPVTETPAPATTTETPVTETPEPATTTATPVTETPEPATTTETPVTETPEPTTPTHDSC